MPSEIKGKNVEEIIASWVTELEDRSRAFMRHAGQLADWDRDVMIARRSLLDLEDLLKQVSQGQQSLERKLGLLETHQKEVHHSLTSIEAEAARMHQEERSLGDDDAEDRDALYERADRVAAALASTGDQLRDVICDVNEGATASQGTADSPVVKAVRILNNQLQALTAIDARTSQLEMLLPQVEAQSA